MLEIRHLKTLHALREADSLVDAADRLHLTQSALSHQFKELEERMGMPLFVRKTKPVRFTSAGLRLLQLADATLPLLRGAERDIARLAGGTAGRLHMAIECHSCFQWLMPTIDQFRDAWPEVELDLASGFSFAPLPALARGDLDLVDGRHQPLEATVAFDGHVQAPGGAPGQTADVAFGGAQQWQGGVGQLQQAQTGAGEAHRFGLAHEQRHAHAFFQLLELVRQGRLGQVQAIGRIHQAVGFTQGVQGLEVTDFKHRGLHE